MAGPIRDLSTGIRAKTKKIYLAPKIAIMLLPGLPFELTRRFAATAFNFAPY